MYFRPLFCQLQTYAYGCWNEGKSTQFIFSAFCLQKPCFAMLSYALTVYTPTVFGKLLWTENGLLFPDGQIWFCRSLRNAPPEMREQRDRERETPQSFHDRPGVKMVQPSPPILRPVRQRVQRGARRRLWERERREIESGTSHSLRERHEVRIWEATKGARHKRESHPFYNIFFVYHPYFCLESSD